MHGHAHKLPITAIIVTKNEAGRIETCLRALHDFADILVVDSNSTDATKEIAASNGAQIINFTWNGHYPKKRQWILDNVPLDHDWVFFIDADEICTPAFTDELKKIEWKNNPVSGYFVHAKYIVNSKIMQHGLRNKKLCLLHKNRIAFLPAGDANIPEMGEIEGHYQPVPKPGIRAKIATIKSPVLHNAMEDKTAWLNRHNRYAHWECEMDRKKLWPSDPSPYRRMAKAVFKALPCRPHIAFVHSYIIRLGVLDGREGLELARSRYLYYRMISALKTSTGKAQNAASATPEIAPRK